ncbi:hypothetical protein CWD63_24370 [Raoultella ornithinolytica]|nr:hypothetical protein CWD63_24370 [Raoultella ornithinolytica]
MAYITLSSLRVNLIFQKFSLSTRRLVCRCSVSMEAHYREPNGNDKRKNTFLFQPLIFCT